MGYSLDEVAVGESDFFGSEADLGGVLSFTSNP
jgi:hypothetical protein